MKRMYLKAVFALMVSTILCLNVFALNVGDKIGDVLNTDVKTYINGERIPCYNINGKAVVIVADLRNYGFDSVYNDNARTSTITRNYNKDFTPIKNIANNTAKAGTIAFPYLYTDISAVLDGIKLDSFNINGNIVIYFESLKDYGTFSWNGETMSSELTLHKLLGTVYPPTTGTSPIPVTNTAPTTTKNAPETTSKKLTSGIHKDENMKVVVPLYNMDKFVVFWGYTGDKIHIKPDCSTFKNGVLFGTYDEAVAYGRDKGWCGRCSDYWTDERFFKDGNSNVK